MAEYLKKYVDRVGDVPAQLHRLFALIRDLDQRVAKLQDDVEDKCRQQLAGRTGRGEGQLTKRQRTAAAAGDDSALAAEIEAGMQKLVSLSEEKVRVRAVAASRLAALAGHGQVPSGHMLPLTPCPQCIAAAQIKIASQVYDYVDSHIRQLDEDLMQFDEDIAADKVAAGEAAALGRGQVGGSGGGLGCACSRGGDHVHHTGPGRRLEAAAAAGARFRPVCNQPPWLFTMAGRAHRSAPRRHPRRRRQQRQAGQGQERGWRAAAEAQADAQEGGNSRCVVWDIVAVGQAAGTLRGAPWPPATSPPCLPPACAVHPPDPAPPPPGLHAAPDGPPLPDLVDPSEPRYCLCNNVSYGEMIMCDNKDCEKEWFHVGCVNVTMPLKGKWYCSPECEAHALEKGL